MEQEKDKRRSFLKHILAGSAVVVTTAAAIKPAKAKSGPQMTGSDEVLYKESAEFSKYYKSLRS
ncbi:twin-arginine translocation signal domain-containing protein [Desulfopila aestuarii]|uniref:Tat (Twin-arginine translocation) pathway signal sequence n=1 Tax=Desulfopila aestuarii DSM 18488 TaxID=1121416 RepID=A0A1M7Y7Q1_9BACT|nr:twin-arginine translocation signal domain-containing protein [Desulfopila aestuarii]SHO48663.1 Tat (twin-arginine translocation) pathway signal sequence [Desulfopila aestuarii DSM 18488]